MQNTLHMYVLLYIYIYIMKIIITFNGHHYTKRKENLLFCNVFLQPFKQVPSTKHYCMQDKINCWP